jgi:hypothetical protein
VTYLWYEQVQTTGLGADIPWPSVVDGVRLMAQLLVFPLGMEGSSAEVAGAVVLIGTVALVVWGIASSRSDSTAMWVGIAVFGLGATASLAFGRYTLITAFGNSNRYTSVPTVALIGLAGLLMSAIREYGERGGEPHRARARATGAIALTALAGVAVVATVTGGAHLADMRHKVSEQELREIALHLDLADGTRYLAGYETTVTDLLEAIGHQPFVDGWDLDCGLLGEQLDATSVAVPNAGEVVSARHLLLLGDAVEITGRVTDEGPHVRCVVVTDDEGLVIGAGALDVDGVAGTGADSDRSGFVAIAPPGEDLYRVHAVVEGRDDPVLIGDVDASEIAPAGPSPPQP